MMYGRFAVRALIASLLASWLASLSACAVGPNFKRPPAPTATGYPDRPDPSDAAAEVWALVEKAQGGDAEAFGKIYDRYVDAVFRFVYFRVGNRQLAEDLTSETFLAAMDSARKDDPPDITVRWLIGVARHKLADHLLAQARSARRLRCRRNCSPPTDIRRCSAAMRCRTSRPPAGRSPCRDPRPSCPA